MFAYGVSWYYSVYVNEKSVLNLKILIIKMFLLFFRHELSICLISENLNFTITELFLKGLLVKFYHQKEFRHLKIVVYAKVKILIWRYLLDFNVFDFLFSDLTSGKEVKMFTEE